MGGGNEQDELFVVSEMEGGRSPSKKEQTSCGHDTDRHQKKTKKTTTTALRYKRAKEKLPRRTTNWVGKMAPLNGEGVSAAVERRQLQGGTSKKGRGKGKKHRRERQYYREMNCGLD